jgi:hypothetical protein
MKQRNNGVKFDNIKDAQLMEDFRNKKTIQELAEKYQETEYYIEKRIEFLHNLNHRALNEEPKKEKKPKKVIEK